MLKILKEFCLSIYDNPTDGWRMIKMIGGGLVLLLFGAICIGAHECGKIIVDKIKTKG